MAEAKTQPTRASVSAYIDALPDARMRDDCRRLVTLMTRVSGASPIMWGTSIVGFDTYRYTYASGATGDWPVIGFAPRARDLTLYLMDGFEQRAQALARLGRHTHSKSCLHVKSLADIDLSVLEAMLADSVRVMRARYPTGAVTGAAANAAADAASGAATRRLSASSASSSENARRAATHASPGHTAAQRKVAKNAVKPAATKPAQTSTRPLTKKAAANKAAKRAGKKATKRAAKSATKTVAKANTQRVATKAVASTAAARRAVKQVATTATSRARRT